MEDSMSERSSYLPGTPSWVDVQSPDTTAAAALYGGLFGWEAQIDPREDAGGYGMFTLGGKVVAGLGPVMNPGMPPFWSVYVTVSDADATLEAATAHGATVVAGPMDIFDAGRMAVLQDPVGSFVSIWQPGVHIGARLVNEAGTFAWNELATTDLPAASEFYTSVFGWGLDTSSDASAIFTVADSMVCGAHVAGEYEFPAWSIWFAVEDCDGSAVRATELGGSVMMPPGDMDFGRGAVLADPHGAVFGVGVLNEEPAPTAG
jgi:predicted enzyme related to lactoylglutathione lyase